jgi:hypothetical protein
LIDLVLELVVAPALVGAATLAARRWGQRTGGLVSAFPAIVGPVLLVAALDHGAAFAASAANGTLLGLVALAGFALVYGRLAPRTAWPASLAAAWVAAAALGTAVAAVAAGPPAGLLAAAVSLVAAARLLPRAPDALPAVPAVPRWDLPVRMALTALLAVSLTAAANRAGPVAGGMLAALPVLASILAVFTHARYGAAAVAELLRGMLAGMAGFVSFCALVAALAEPAGIAAAFVVATVAALAVQLATARLGRLEHVDAEVPVGGARGVLREAGVDLDPGPPDALAPLAFGLDGAHRPAVAADRD